MAKKPTTKKTDEVTDTAVDGVTIDTTALDAAISDMQRVNPDVFYHKFRKPDGAPNPIVGYLLDRRQRKLLPEDEEKGEQHYYIMCLTIPTVLWKHREEGQEEGEAFIAEPGAFAWVDERWCLRNLAKHLPRTVEDDNGVVGWSALFRVAIVPRNQRNIGKGRRVWNAEVYAQSVDPSSVPAAMLLAPHPNAPPPMLGSEDDEIPF